MDIAAMSAVMATNQARSDASLAIMDKAMGIAEQQGQQLMEMLSPESNAPHPTLGNIVDVEV
ncbi:YjfB family protein [Lentibacillus sp. N15]|uniref:YjfB family protein n=1 Tax=Lentibacillus songyuanensis TaxID=3136161 RepID=UPI0031BB0C5B